MKRIKNLVGLLATLIFCACSMGNKSQEEAAQRERDSLQHVISTQEAEMNDMMATIQAVQEGIARINEAQGRVIVNDSSIESASTQEVIRENMNFIQEEMKQNKLLIKQLTEKLKSNSAQADKLARVVENLKQQVEAQQTRIQELEQTLMEKNLLLTSQGEQIDSLSKNNESLTKENQTKSHELANQDKELNRGWFAVGNKTELKEQKILQDGEVLRGDFNKDYFTPIDVRYDKTIRLFSKRVKILTNHPEGSYELVKDSEGQYELHVINPTQFWQTSKYLVVLVR